MSQTSYTVNQLVAFEGARGDSRPMDCWTGRNTDAGEIAYGRALVADAAATNINTAVPCKVFNATGQTIQGFGVADLSHEPQTTGVPVGGSINLMRKGTIWVLPEQDVLPSDPVFVRHTLAGATGTSPAIGKVRKDADTAKADAFTSARFAMKALAGQPCLLIINLP